MLRAMENGPDDFLTVLQKGLAARAAWLEKSAVPALGDGLRTFKSLLASMVGTLVKKGLLGEDRYDYDGQPTELETPPDTPIPEGEEAEAVGSRLAAYRRQIELLVSSTPFSLDTLKFGQLRKMSSLFAYIDWPAFGEGAHSITTRAFAQLAAKVRLSPDALSARVVHESLAQIQSLAADIGAHLAEVEAWQRESWKAEVRAKAFAAFASRGAHVNADRTEELQAFKRAFDKAPTGSWNPELAQQILDEEFSADAAARKEILLSSLSVPQPRAAVTEPAVDHRLELIDAIRDVCHVGRELSVAEGVLVANEHALETRTLGVFGRLRRFFHRIMGTLRDRYYEINLNPRGASRPEFRTETIDFLRFVADVRELRSVLGELGGAETSEGRRVQAMSEEELCGLLGWQVQQLRHTYRRMEGLNAYFQLRAVEDQGAAARSIKLELLRIENSIARADKVHNECAARSPGGIFSL
jgi:hypothetical protein